MIAIIGAGVSGLTVGRSLKGDFLILEKTERPGGLAGEYRSGGYAFPYGGHYFHFQNKIEVERAVLAVAPFRRYRRRSAVRLGGRTIPFPIQYHLAFLPAAEREVIAREMLAAPSGPTPTLDAFVRRHFGERLRELFFRPFLEKFYCRGLEGLMADMDKGSMPVPSRAEVRAGLAGRKFSAGYNSVFHYPEDCSLSRFVERYAEPVAGRIRLQTEVTGVDLRRRELRTSGGPVSYRFLINTMPLNRFLELCGRPQEAARLAHISTLVVNGLVRRRRRRFHWLYLPERVTPFYRAGYYPARAAVPIYLERSLPRPAAPRFASLRDEAAAALRHAGMIERSTEILHLDPCLIPVSYVLFDPSWRRTVPPLLLELRRRGVYSIGRYGSWNYTSMADDMREAQCTAEFLNCQ